MGKAKFMCEYCQKAFDDSQEARRRHFQGRNHKANVKLWYDSFADQEHRAAAASTSTLSASPWVAAPVASDRESNVNQQPAAAPVFDLRSLPPSMIPPPPDAFLYRRTDWG